MYLFIEEYPLFIFFGNDRFRLCHRDFTVVIAVQDHTFLLFVVNHALFLFFQNGYWLLFLDFCLISLFCHHLRLNIHFFHLNTLSLWFHQLLSQNFTFLDKFRKRDLFFSSLFDVIFANSNKLGDFLIIKYKHWAVILLFRCFLIMINCNFRYL